MRMVQIQTDGCNLAAEYGHVECLRVAHELGGKLEFHV